LESWKQEARHQPFRRSSWEPDNPAVVRHQGICLPTPNHPSNCAEQWLTPDTPSTHESLQQNPDYDVYMPHQKERYLWEIFLIASKCQSLLWGVDVERWIYPERKLHTILASTRIRNAICSSRLWHHYMSAVYITVCIFPRRELAGRLL
jgi:hypothetical protein